MELVLWQIILGLAVALGAGGGAGFALRKRILDKKSQSVEEKVKQLEVKARAEALKIKDEALAKVEKRQKELEETERKLRQREDKISESFDSLTTERKELQKRQDQVEKIKTELIKLRAKQLKLLEQKAKLKREDALKIIMKSTEREYKDDIVKQIKKYKQILKEDAEKESKKILSTVIERLASEHTAESTSYTVQLPSDDLKGRIIGKEGRNIQHFEKVTGCDVIIGDSPESVQVASFDPVRRYVGKLVLEKLVSDGRIHQSRIEELTKKMTESVNKEAKKSAEEVAYEIGLPGLPGDLLKIVGRLKFRTSYGQNQLEHAKEVATIAGMLANELGADVNIAKKAGFLHDVGKAVDHEVEGAHHHISMDIARKFGMSEEVINAIGAHHDDIEPKTVEAILVKSADAISGGRPGARRESVEQYIKRLTDLENIATGFGGVKSAFAIQAGREVRILVKPEEINDLEALKLAKDIAQKIEKDMQYPGQIKVNVIRETRAEEIAK